MNKLIEAIYEHGVLRPLHPLQLREGESVRVAVVTESDHGRPPALPWDAAAARAAMKRIAALPTEGPAEGEAVGRKHDRYLYGDCSEKGRPW